VVEYSVIDLYNMMKTSALPAYGEEPKLAELTPDEVNAINERLAQLIENEEIFGVIWEGKEAVYEAVRAVKKWTHTDFKGPQAEGDELDLDVIDAPDVMVSGTPLTKFEKSVTAGTAYYWSDSGDEKVKLNEDEAIVIFGWYDPVDSPKATRVLFQLPKRNFLVKLPFRFAKDLPMIVHRPVIVKPKEAFRVRVRYDADGEDALMPIGIKVTKAQNESL